MRTNCGFTSPVERVAERLALPSEPAESLARLGDLDPPAERFRLPGEGELDRQLAQLGVAADARIEIVSGRPSPVDQPEAWWVLERLHHELLTRPGRGYPPPWPAPPRAGDPRSRYFHLYAFVGALAEVRRFHAAHEIPDDVSWATLGDVGLSVERHRREWGRPGFDNAAWIWHHFRGELVRLGRLQFTRGHVEFDPGPDAPDHVRPGVPAVGVHIPRGGGLDPVACDESLARARHFLPAHLPDDEPARVATCSSWLLDPRLADHLAPGSNIVRFQRRFTLSPHVWPGDEDVLRFVFGFGPAGAPDPDDLPRTTTLERVIADHLGAGGHWHVRHGWLEF